MKLILQGDYYLWEYFPDNEQRKERPQTPAPRTLNETDKKITNTNFRQIYDKSGDYVVK